LLYPTLLRRRCGGNSPLALGFLNTSVKHTLVEQGLRNTSPGLRSG
jgi:hypothetical protein